MDSVKYRPALPWLHNKPENKNKLINDVHYSGAMLTLLLPGEFSTFESYFQR